MFVHPIDVKGPFTVVLEFERVLELQFDEYLAS